VTSTRTELRLSGTTKLAAALADAARWHGVPLAVESGSRGAMLTCWSAGAVTSSVEVTADEALPAALVDDALDRFTAGWPMAPGRASLTVLAPALGVCGPATAGPVNAVRNDGAWISASARTVAFVRLLTDQQTRCWLASCVFDGVPARPGRPLSGDIELLGAQVAADTARVAEFMQDRGLGDDWPQLLLLGEPSVGPDDTVSVLIAFTEAGYARALLSAALNGGKK
jgi:hypothetical protein